jgi:hypothetical protein
MLYRKQQFYFVDAMDDMAEIEEMGSGAGKGRKGRKGRGRILLPFDPYMFGYEEQKGGEATDEDPSEGTDEKTNESSPRGFTMNDESWSSYVGAMVRASQCINIYLNYIYTTGTLSKGDSTKWIPGEEPSETFSTGIYGGSNSFSDSDAGQLVSTLCSELVKFAQSIISDDFASAVLSCSNPISASRDFILSLLATAPEKQVDEFIAAWMLRGFETQNHVPGKYTSQSPYSRSLLSTELTQETVFEKSPLIVGTNKPIRRDAWESVDTDKLFSLASIVLRCHLRDRPIIRSYSLLTFIHYVVSRYFQQENKRRALNYSPVVSFSILELFRMDSTIDTSILAALMCEYPDQYSMEMYLSTCEGNVSSDWASRVRLLIKQYRDKQRDWDREAKAYLEEVRQRAVLKKAEEESITGAETSTPGLSLLQTGFSAPDGSHVCISYMKDIPVAIGVNQSGMVSVIGVFVMDDGKFIEDNNKEPIIRAPSAEEYDIVLSSLGN